MKEDGIVTIDILTNNEEDEAVCQLKGNILLYEAQKESQNADNQIKLANKNNEHFIWVDFPSNLEISKEEDPITPSPTQNTDSKTEATTNNQNTSKQSEDNGNYLDYSRNILLYLLLILL